MYSNKRSGSQEGEWMENNKVSVIGFGYIGSPIVAISNQRQLAENRLSIRGMLSAYLWLYGGAMRARKE
jgi:hypothetical protein